MKRLYVSAIIAGAGLGKRMGGKVRKPLLTIDGRPILIYTLRNLVRVEAIREVILVVNPRDLELVQKELGQDLTSLRVKDVIPGGSHRFDSVKLGLKHVSDCADLVLIHDAVRPFAPPELIEKVIARAHSSGAAILATPVIDTVKRVRSSRISGTVDRASLWLAQTPQVFRRDIIQAAYDCRRPPKTSDDAQLVERTGRPVAVVPGSPLNFKITTPDDLELARAAQAVVSR
jgi:2-C-methyl-D-erythritol 4-phosphate cytidylyltransferase